MRRALVPAALGLAACGEPAAEDAAAGASAPEARFADATARSGLVFTATAGAVPPTQILEVKGGGVALLDWRGDGRWDVLVPNGATLESPDRGPGARLFANRGGLRFEDATAECGLDLARWGMGCAVGDVDGDGLDDAFVACFGPDALLVQGADGELVERGAAAGVAGAEWGSGAAFGDLDLDGDLDLFVANYLAFDPAAPPPPTEFLEVEVFGGPAGLDPQRDRVYENAGDGTFRDRSVDFGLDDVAPAFGLGCVALDLDLDGHQDVYVGNDSMPNHLWLGRGGWRAEEAASERGVAVNADGAAQATMGIAVTDVDGDLRPDLFTTNFAQDTNTLWLSREGGRWRDSTLPWGLGAPSSAVCGWAALFGDHDLDGDEDLLVLDGHVYPDAAAKRLGSARAQPPLLFDRDGRRFERVPLAGEPALDGAWCDRGAAQADLDADGDLDVVAVESNGPLRVLEGRATDRGGRAFVLSLRDGRPGNPRGLGARVTLRAGDRVETRWIHSGGSYQSASAPEAVFAAPPPDVEVTIDVLWPDGREQVASRVGVAGRWVVARGE